MHSPPRDFQGNVVPYDDPQIEGGDGLLRGITEHHIVPDNIRGGKKVSSSAVNPSSGPNGGMSVDIESFLARDNRDPIDWCKSRKWLGAIRFPASVPRQLNLSVGRDPLPENPYHGQVWGAPLKRSPVKRKILKSSSWVIEIDGVSLNE
jgi:hypothetical protein